MFIRSECTEHTLNVSDHLALSLTLLLNPSSSLQEDSPPRTDWNKAGQLGMMSCYEAAVHDAVLPPLGATNNSIDELENEIRLFLLQSAVLQ